MIRLPFSRTPKNGDDDNASVAFADYCRDELERRRDSGRDFDEERFKAAVDLVLTRLQAAEETEGKA